MSSSSSMLLEGDSSLLEKSLHFVKVIKLLLADFVFCNF